MNVFESIRHLNAGAFERHRIHLTRTYEEKPLAVCVDRHKALQILINLLRNAKYALDPQDARDRPLAVQVAATGANRVRIVVRDNGVGIALENLIRIFSHRFTTRKDGHGFGLHSGANAAKEMGGRLTVASAGPRQGAEFVLELPAALETPALFQNHRFPKSPASKAN